MERSRKGTRLNDAQYFRQPLPHARYKMTKLRVIPKPNEAMVDHVKNPIWMRYQSNSLNRDQPSTEITMITFKNKNKNDYSVENFNQNRQEIAIETLPEVEISNKTLPQIDEFLPKSEIIINTPPKTSPIPIVKLENKPMCRHEEIRIAKREKIHTPKKETHLREDNDEKPISWWRTIINYFFGAFLGRRESNHEKQSKKRKIRRNDPRTYATTTKSRNLNTHQYHVSLANKRISH